MEYINVHAQEHSGGSIKESVKERGMGLEGTDCTRWVFLEVIGS